MANMFDFSLKKKLTKAEKPAEQIASEEISETLSAFKKRANTEASEKSSNTNSEFWFAVYFADEAQRNQFLRKIDGMGLLNDQYINGEALAKKLGVELTPKKIKKPKPFRSPKNIEDIIGF